MSETDPGPNGPERRRWMSASDGDKLVRWTPVALLLFGTAYWGGQMWALQPRLERIETRGDERDRIMNLLPAKDAEILGKILNLDGKLDSVWTRQAEDQRNIAALTAQLAELRAALAILREQRKEPRP